jgi:predicted phosphodiesterase
MNKKFSNIEVIIAIGDTHSLNLKPLFDRKIPKNVKNCIFFHVGDCGEGFDHVKKEDRFLRGVYQYLIDIDSYLIICRGNHSDPAYFDDEHFQNKKFGDRIYFAPDYTVIEFNGKTAQIIGGGISIDRSDRIAGQSWWSKEVVNYMPENVKKVDILFTHVPPEDVPFQKANANPTVAHYHSIEAMTGDDLFGELAEERKIVQKISDASECSQHFYGHFHTSHLFFQQEKNRKYIGLGIDEIKEVIY